MCALKLNAFQLFKFFSQYLNYLFNSYESEIQTISRTLTDNSSAKLDRNCITIRSRECRMPEQRNTSCSNSSFESLSISDNCDDVENRQLSPNDHKQGTDIFEVFDYMEKRNRTLQEQLGSAEVQIKVLLLEKAALLKNIYKNDLKIISLQKALNLQLLFKKVMERKETPINLNKKYA